VVLTAAIFGKSNPGIYLTD